MVTIGYGFDARSISNNDMLRFFLKYDDEERISDMIAETLSERKDVNNLTESDMEKLADSVRSWIEDDSETVADYIADIINYEEKAARRMHEQDVVAVYDNYVVFDSVLFPEDRAERLRRIRTKKDFVRMIRDYLPCKELVFGPIHDGAEFSDHNYWISSDI